MDLQCLVAAHMPDRRGRAKMTPAAEDSYYGNRIALPRPSRRRLLSIAAAGAILMLVGIAQI